MVFRQKLFIHFSLCFIWNDFYILISSFLNFLRKRKSNNCYHKTNIIAILLIKTKQKSLISPTGTRTRVSRVKTWYPNQLDYWGLVTFIVVKFLKNSFLKNSRLWSSEFSVLTKQKIFPQSLKHYESFQNTFWRNFFVKNNKKSFLFFRYYICKINRNLNSIIL